MDELKEKLKTLHEASFQWALHCSQGRRQDAEDALQAAYEAVLDGSASFGGRGSFKSFFFGVIRNKVRSGRRKNKAGRQVALEAIAEPEVAAVAVDKMEQAERRQAIGQAIATLSDRQQEVLELVFYHDLTIDEAATTMGVKLGTARTHYKRAKRALSEQFERGEFQWLSTTIGS